MTQQLSHLEVIMIPSIGTSGIFTFASPYDIVGDPTLSYTVTSIRTIDELIASGESPFEMIYTPVGESRSVMDADIANGVVIITFRTESGDSYFYIPSNKLTSTQSLSGELYVEKTAIVNIGHLPKNIDLTVAKQIIIDTLHDTIGITPIVEFVDTSADIRVNETKHTALVNIRKNIVITDQSYRTRYQELLNLYDRQQVFINNMNAVYINNANGVVI